ncbi:MAG TPA: DUF3568 family protein [Arenibacter sp.]|jgi:hypothetical protein|nr:DUF3568 family protein [Desulfobacterium sp.]HUH45729.1 DUF3568 family protein [Arenibacter sp.]
MKKINGLILSLFVCFQLCGCGALIAGGAAAGATYVYTAGWVEKNYTANVDKVYKASLIAAEKMGMVIETKTISVVSAEIKAVKGDKEYWFKMEEKSQNLTTLSIREGVMGNKEASQAIHKKIEKLL